MDSGELYDSNLHTCVAALLTYYTFASHIKLVIAEYDILYNLKLSQINRLA